MDGVACMGCGGGGVKARGNCATCYARLLGQISRGKTDWSRLRAEGKCGPRRGPDAASGELTGRQGRVLRFVVERLLAGQPASFRDICLEFGLASTNGATAHVVPLERKGYLRRGDETKSRSLLVPGARLRLEYTDDEAGRRLREFMEGGVAGE